MAKSREKFFPGNFEAESPILFFEGKKDVSSDLKNSTQIFSVTQIKETIVQVEKKVGLRLM